MKFALISLVVLLTLIETEGCPWSKLAENVCFKTKNNGFGTLRYYGDSGFVVALKLVYRSGLVKCSHANSLLSRWGCHGLRFGSHTNVLNVVITDEMNHVIYPRNESIVHEAGLWYVLPGVHDLNSKELAFTNFATPFYLQSLMYLRVWYGEDLTGWTETDNDGQACVDIHARFI